VDNKNKKNYSNCIVALILNTIAAFFSIVILMDVLNNPSVATFLFALLAFLVIAQLLMLGFIITVYTLVLLIQRGDLSNQKKDLSLCIITCAVFLIALVLNIWLWIVIYTT